MFINVSFKIEKVDKGWLVTEEYHLYLKDEIKTCRSVFTDKEIMMKYLSEEFDK